MTLVEKVARAIARNKRGSLATDADIDRAYTAYIGQSRAAIAAVFDWLAEPGDDAIIAGHEATVGVFDLNAAYTRIWTAMLAAKRKEALG